MAFKEFINKLSKEKKINIYGYTVVFYSGILKKGYILFSFDNVCIHYGLQDYKLSYEDFSKLKVQQNTKGLIFTKEVISLVLNKNVIIKNIEFECQNIICSILETTKLSIYSSPKKDLEDFNNSNNSDFKFPLTALSFDCMENFSFFEHYNRTDFGKQIIIPSLDFSTDNPQSYLDFMKTIFESYNENSCCYFFALGSFYNKNAIVLNLDHSWYMLRGNDFYEFEENELDIYIEENHYGKFAYLAEQTEPPGLVAEFDKIEIYDDYIDSIFLEYDYDLFHPTENYDDEYDEDDSEEIDDDDFDDEEDDCYETNDSDDDYYDESEDSYDNEEDLDFDTRILNRAEELGLSSDTFMPITDGIVNEERYYDSDYQILWVLKEPYDKNEEEKGGWSLSGNLATDPCDAYYSNTTYRRLIDVSYCILNDIDEFTDDLSDEDIENTVNSIAIINTSKMPGETRSKDHEIKKAYRLWRDILLDQIESYQPDIIIFGVGQTTFNAYYNNLDDIEGDPSWLRMTRGNQLILNSYHPSSSDFSGQDILDSVEIWKNGED